VSTADEDRPTILTYAGVLLRVTYTTLAYWFVGLMPEENHCRKALAWMRIDAYRFAAWHWRKYLKYSEDSRARASLGWCYANLGMIESAVEHYRLAYARNKDPEIGLYLAQVELDFGKIPGT
jgi:tetratricopeptide (TPR) repeat protein